MADGEAVVVQNVHALGTVTGGTVDLSPSAVTDVTGGVGNLPAIDEHCWILLFWHNCTIRQSQIIQWVTITTTTQAHGGQSVVIAVHLYHHHARSVEPLDLQTSWTSD